MAWMRSSWCWPAGVRPGGYAKLASARPAAIDPCIRVSDRDPMRRPMERGDHSDLTKPFDPDQAVAGGGLRLHRQRIIREPHVDNHGHLMSSISHHASHLQVGGHEVRISLLDHADDRAQHEGMEFADLAGELGAREILDELGARRRIDKLEAKLRGSVAVELSLGFRTCFGLRHRQCHCGPPLSRLWVGLVAWGRSSERMS